jgi:hypothetical protein
VLFHPVVSASPTACETKPSISGLRSFSLGWLLKVGSGSFTLTTAIRPSRRSSPVGTGSFSLMIPALGVAVDRAGQGDLEALGVRAAVDVVDVVGEGQHHLVVAVVVLHRDFADERWTRVFLAE